MLLAKTFLIAGAVFGGSGVALGAFGAHALKARLDASSLSTWETAVLYQLVHGLALLVVGVWLLQGGPAVLRWAGWGYLIGVLLFSGSLYLLATLGASWLGPVTPLGGVAFIIGWLALLWAAFAVDG